VADDTVDLVVTSPPYFALRSYQDDGGHYDGQIGSEATPAEFLDALWAVTAECVRVLKPSGSLWVNLGDKYSATHQGVQGRSGQVADRTHARASARVSRHTAASGVRTKSLMGLPWRYAIGCIDDLGLILRAEVIWSKPNGLPESVTDRVRRSHEQWFHFTLEPRYFSALDEIREPYISAPAKAFAAGATRNPALCPDHDLEHNPLGKLPGSVWSIPSEPLQVPDDLGVDHFAAFPQEWPRRLILGWCPAEVCTACGQGRAPVSDRTVEKWQTGHKKTDSDSTQMGGGRAMTANRDNGPLPNTVTHTITGYACACPDTTAPSTPGVVLDPFAGTGTVPMVARALGRTGIGVDLSSDYLRLAAWRVFESGHASKTVARTNGERQGLLL
jgi:DNA modification methylase